MVDFARIATQFGAAGPASVAMRDAGTLELVGDNPEHRAVLRSREDLRQDIELDAVLFYTGRTPDGRADRHLALDLRLGWRPIPTFSISLI